MLTVVLVVQLLAAGAIVAALMRLAGMAPLPALAIALACVVLVRMGITANNFMLSARFGSATPSQFQLTPWGRVKLFAEEFCASMLCSSWFVPRGRPRTRIYPDSKGPPVLLLHGYGCNSGYWARLTPLLDAAHISHAAIDLEPVMAGIDDYVPQVERGIEALCAASGAAKVIIVAHSMGGLVARAWLRDHGAARVAHIFTLGTPHHGTALANLGPGENAVQMRLLAAAGEHGNASGNAWLHALAGSENPASRALVTSIYTHHDNIVSPQTSSLLPGARNIEVGGVGHVALAANRLVLTRLLREIAMMSTR